MKICLLLIFTVIAHTVALGTVTDFQVRSEFALRLSKLRLGTSSRNEVLKLVGMPATKVKHGDHLFPYYRAVSEIWHFSSSKGCKFPDLGTVMFDGQGAVLSVFGNQPPNLRIKSIKYSLTQWLCRVDSSPGLYARNFNTETVVRLCRDLSRLGVKEAGIILEEYVRLKPCFAELGGPEVDLTSSAYGNDGRVFIIIKTMTAGLGIKLTEPFPSEFILGLEQTGNRARKVESSVIVYNGLPVVVVLGHLKTNVVDGELKTLCAFLKVSNVQYNASLSTGAKWSCLRFVQRSLKLNETSSKDSVSLTSLLKKQLGLNGD